MRSALVLLAFGCSAAFSRGAAPTWHLNAQIYSFHEHTSAEDLHNTTPGLGLIRRENNWLAGVGVFRNSIGRWAGHGYAGWQYPFRHVRIGGIAGITHHYFWNDGGIVPLAAAVITVHVAKTLALDFVAIPHLRNATYATLNVSRSWQFR
ncbi:MAG TPA: hypothetical protein VM029_16720 [Opitutaceae bacterium]|nr:hypothetical protein [Opitutaceae bacterium]